MTTSDDERALILQEGPVLEAEIGEALARLQERVPETMLRHSIAIASLLRCAFALAASSGVGKLEFVAGVAHHLAAEEESQDEDEGIARPAAGHA